MTRIKRIHADKAKSINNGQGKGGMVDCLDMVANSD